MDHDAGVMSEFTKDMESKGMLLYLSECLIVAMQWELHRQRNVTTYMNA